MHTGERVEELLHDRVHRGLGQGAVSLEKLLAVAAGHEVEHDGEVLGAHVQPVAADDVRVHAHAQQLDLVLKVALRTQRERNGVLWCEWRAGAAAAACLQLRPA